jgi:hypothetical protein
MAQKKRKTRPPRAPFLITIATLASALVPACGGNVGGNTGNSGAGGSPGTGGAGTGGAITGAGGTGANPGDCPSPQPPDGTTCVTEGRRCSYEYCYDPSGITLACTHGVWVRTSFSTCNPPPPQEEVCPMQQPVEGAGCFVDPNLSCSYVTSYCCGQPSSSIAYACQGYAWQSTGGGTAGSCNPPAPYCPPIRPHDGDPCCFVGPPAGCFYLGGNGIDNQNASADCDGTRWRVLTGFQPWPIDAGLEVEDASGTGGSGGAWGDGGRGETDGA